MPRFLAVHTVPPMTEADYMQQGKGLMEKMSQLPPDTKFNLSYCDLAGGKIFCDWEAPTRETVEQVFKMIEMPFDAIYPVKLFSMAKMAFED